MSDDLGTMVVRFSADLSGLAVGAEEAEEKLSQVESAATKMGAIFSSVPPYNVGDSISDVQVAQAKLTLIESKVNETREKLQSLQNAADAGKAVTGIPEATSNLVLLENQAQQAREKLQELEAPAEAVFHFRFSGLIQGLSGIAEQAGNTITNLQSLYGVATGIGGQLYNAFIVPNASMEQTTVAFQTLLGKGKATQDFLQKMKDFAAATPFEFPDVATAAQHMLAFGFSAKDVIPTLTNIGDAMGSMGKGSAEIDQIVTVFGQMHAAGKLNAGDMDQIVSQGIPAWKYLADAMHKTVPEVQDLSSQGLIPADKAIQAVSDGMHKMFGGGMAQQANTFNGLLSTLQDNAGAAMRAFSGPLFDMAKQGLTELGNIVSSKQFQDFATTMGKDVAGAFSQLGEVFESVFGNINPADLASSFEQVAAVVQDLSGDIKDFASGIIDAATKSGAIQSVLKTIRDLLPTVGTFLTNTGNDLKQNLLPPLESLITNVGKTVKNFSDWLDKSGILKTAINDLGPVVHTTSVFVGGLVQGVSDLLGFLNQDTPAANLFKDALIGVGVAMVAMKVADFVKGIGDMIGNIKDATTKFLDFAGDIKGKVADALHSLSVNNLQEVQNSLEETGKTSHTTATSIEQDYTQVGFYADEAAAQVETIGPAAETSAGEVGTASATMEADMNQVGVSADAAAAQVEAVGPEAVAAEAEANTAMAGVESKAAVAQSTIGGLTNVLGGLLNLINIGESTINRDKLKQEWIKDHPNGPPPPDFVGFASGGFTPGGPIVVGENGPEILVPPKGSAIIPNSVFSGGSPALSVASGDGGTVHIHNHLYIDGHEMASVMLNPLGEAMAGKIRTYGPVSGAAA